MTAMRYDERVRTVRRAAVIVVIGAALAVGASCSRSPSATPHQAFRTPEDAVKALNEAVKKGGGGAEEVVAIFGPEGKDLIDSSDPVAARRRREVFAIALKEGLAAGGRWSPEDTRRR